MTTAVNQYGLDGGEEGRQEDMASEVLYHEERVLLMLTAVTRWTTKGRIGEKWKQIIKDDVRAGVNLALKEVRSDLVAACGECKGAELASKVSDRLDLFRSIYTPRQEKAAFHRSMPRFSMYERRVGKARGDLAYCTVIADWLELKMKYDHRCVRMHSNRRAATRTHVLTADRARLSRDVCRRFRDDVLVSSELWKTGALRTPQTCISDITHGSYFRRSYLSAISSQEERNDLRVGLILGYDDLELCNPLGAVRTKHKTACFYIALANLPAHRRFVHDDMCVLMLILEKVLSACGAVRVVAGADATTGQIYEQDFTSFGAQLRASIAGQVFVQVCHTCQACTSHVCRCGQELIIVRCALGA